MTKKNKLKKLRLKGVHLPKEIKRRPKKLLKVPGRLHREESQKREKALLKIPVKPTPEKTEQPSPASPKLTDLSFEAIKPDEIEKMLEAMAPQEPKKAEENLRKGKWQAALPHLKKWIVRLEWDWKSITSVAALVIIGLLALIIIFKVYLGTSTWEQDAQKIEIPENQLFQPKTSDAEKTIDKLREKVDRTYQQETGKTSPTLPIPRTTTSTSTKSPSQTITKQSSYVRTGSASTTPGEMNDNILRKFLADAGDLYYMIPKDGQIQLGFLDSNGDPIQNQMYYTEGGFLTPGRSRGAEFTLYIPRGYMTDIATTTDPCGLVRAIYNGKNYQITTLRSESYLRQKYGGILRNINDCRNRET
ncbi:MAG: hypothetical protein AABX70_07905 [Nanoarchaeota archaeon]